MKTADFIAEQQEQQEEAQGETEACDQAPKQSRAAHLAKWRWSKGQSGNPNGRPKRDFAREFARMVLEAEGDEKALTEYANGFAKQLAKGNAYTFKELAVRAYGNIPQHHTVTNTDEISTLINAGRQRVAARKTQRIQ